jgi:hypothetical protein
MKYVIFIFLYSNLNEIAFQSIEDKTKQNKNESQLTLIESVKKKQNWTPIYSLKSKEIKR